eukprot:XP_025015739.1 uncharacterized protein LOC8261793 isoform X2 [Ricinus communis]
MVIVSGSVDPSTLLRKLVKSGKRAELYPPSSIRKLKQEQANMNQIQFLANEINTPKNQYRFPVSFMNEIGDMRSFENFPNQNIGMKAVGAAIAHHDLMAANRMGNIYMDEDIFASDEGWDDDDIPSLITDADDEENGNGFPGLKGHEFNGMPSYDKHNNLPPLIMANRQQQGHYHNYPLTQRNYLYRQGGHVNENMTNDIYMHQPHVINNALSMSTLKTEYNPYAA